MIDSDSETLSPCESDYSYHSPNLLNGNKIYKAGKDLNKIHFETLNNIDEDIKGFECLGSAANSQFCQSFPSQVELIDFKNDSKKSRTYEKYDYAFYEKKFYDYINLFNAETINIMNLIKLTEMKFLRIFFKKLGVHTSARSKIDFFEILRDFTLKYYSRNSSKGNCCIKITEDPQAIKESNHLLKASFYIDSNSQWIDSSFGNYKHYYLFLHFINL